MSRNGRTDRKFSARRRAASRDGDTPIGTADPEDTPQGAFQPPPAPGQPDNRDWDSLESLTGDS